jgi:predicted CXXCH cytochrome family protein
MIQWTKRLTIGLMFAIPIAMVGFACIQTTAKAQADEPTPVDCKICHSSFQNAWEEGAHGQAATSTALWDAWRDQGEEGRCLTCHTTGYDPTTGLWVAEGIDCGACHATGVENHPAEPMPADRSSKFCGNCHTETYFEWQVSAHAKSEMACLSCHDPHGTQLKAETTSHLCATCHRERASNFAHSEHSAQGLTCADCHLGELEGALGEGHALRDHSFNVRLHTCNECHAYQMHDPGEVHPESFDQQGLEVMTSTDTVRMTTQPASMNPIGFASVAALIGMATGIILAPWLERWYRRLDRGEDRG